MTPLTFHLGLSKLLRMGLIIALLLNNIDFRGIWVPRWALTDDRKIFDYLGGEFNHIFLQVFANGEAYYDSKLAPKRNYLKSNWLKYFLKEAHRRRIKVSAWVNLFYFWGYGEFTQDPAHPLNFAPEWFVKDLQGSILTYSPEELRNKGIEGYFLAPGNPRVKEYLMKIIEEIVTDYDFDGLHLDYVRYPHRIFVHDENLRTSFYRRYYYDPIIFYADSLKSRLGIWGVEDLIIKWENYICDDLSQFVAEINKRIKKIKPKIICSAAVKPDYRIARDEYYQDWLNWLDNDYVDVVCLMAYDNGIGPTLSNLLKKIKDPQKIVVGLGIYCQTAQTIEEQLRLIKKLPFSGFAYFSYTQLKENSEYLKILMALDK